MLFFLSADFFSGIPSECLTVWKLIWFQTVCKSYQQMTLVSKELIDPEIPALLACMILSSNKVHRGKF